MGKRKVVEKCALEGCERELHKGDLVFGSLSYGRFFCSPLCRDTFVDGEVTAVDITVVDATEITAGGAQ